MDRRVTETHIIDLSGCLPSVWFFVLLIGLLFGGLIAQAVIYG